MDTVIGAKLGMEGSGQMPSLLDEYGVFAVLRQHPRFLPNTPNNRRANENRFRGPALQIDFRDTAVDLPAVAISLDSQINQSERRLTRVHYFRGQQNRPGTGPENRLFRPEPLDRLNQILRF